MPQKTSGFVMREMPLQDDLEIIGERPVCTLFAATGYFLEANSTEDTTERPICQRCGSSSLGFGRRPPRIPPAST